jgi:hypothetical protein
MKLKLLLDLLPYDLFARRNRTVPDL